MRRGGVTFKVTGDKELKRKLTGIKNMVKRRRVIHSAAVLASKKYRIAMRTSMRQQNMPEYVVKQFKFRRKKSPNSAWLEIGFFDGRRRIKGWFPHWFEHGTARRFTKQGYNRGYFEPRPFWRKTDAVQYRPMVNNFKGSIMKKIQLYWKRNI